MALQAPERPVTPPAAPARGVSPKRPALPVARQPVTDFSWVVFGKVVLMGSNAVLMLLLAQRMNLVAYGVLVTAVGCQLLLSRLLLMGVDYGIIRLRTMPDLRDRHEDVTRACLTIVLWMSGAALALGAVAIPLLEWLRPHGWLSWAALFIVSGSIGTALVDFGHYYRLSRMHYRTAVCLQAGTAFLRLLLTGAVVLVFSSPTRAVFIAYPAAGLVVGVLHTLILMRSGTGRTDRELIRRIVRYSAWQGAANLAIVLSQHQGSFLLMALGMRKQTGVYGLALTLGLGFFAIYNAYSEFLFPRMMRVKKLSDLPNFLYRSLGVALLLAAGCVPVLLLIGHLGAQHLRPDLQPAISAFYWLAAAMLVLLVQSPLEAACHYLLRPHLQTVNLGVRIVSIAGFGLLLASEQRVTGIAIAQFAGTVVAMGVFFVTVVAEYRAARARTNAAQVR